jgi:hypothetical protein
MLFSHVDREGYKMSDVECATFQEQCIKREAEKELPTLLHCLLDVRRCLAVWNIIKSKFR